MHRLLRWLIRNDIRLPIRAHGGAKKGQLDWRRPSINTLSQMLRHPIYAGAYSYGRRRTDPKRKYSPSNRYRPWAPMEQWRVLLKDRLPAYITWDQYLKNCKQIEDNRSGFACRGVTRRGTAFCPDCWCVAVAAGT